MELKDAVSGLRNALGWTQGELAERAGINRTTLAKIETGANKSSSAAVREALRQAFRLSSDAWDGYLAGTSSIQETASKARRSVAKEHQSEDGPSSEGDLIALERSISAGLAQVKGGGPLFAGIALFDILRDAGQSALSLLPRDRAELDAIVRGWLEAMVYLRARGVEPKLASVLVRSSLVAERRIADAAAESDEASAGRPLVLRELRPRDQQELAVRLDDPTASPLGAFSRKRELLSSLAQGGRAEPHQVQEVERWLWRGDGLVPGDGESLFLPGPTTTGPWLGADGATYHAISVEEAEALNNMPHDGRIGAACFARIEKLMGSQGAEDLSRMIGQGFIPEDKVPAFCAIIKEFRTAPRAHHKQTKPSPPSKKDLRDELPPDDFGGPIGSDYEIPF